MVLSFLITLQSALQEDFPQAKVTSLYQGYQDMSYIALVPKAFEPLGLKLAVVYLHRENSFEFWLAARNRSLQDVWREKLRTKVHEPYTLVEKGKGIDAIVSTTFDGEISFDNQSRPIARLCDTIQAMLSDLDELLQ